MNGSVFVFVFFKGQVYEWDMFRNIGSHTRTTITPPLQVTPSPPTPPLPPLPATLPEYFLPIAFDKVIILQKIMTFFLFSTKVYVTSRETLLVNTHNICFVEK